MQYVMTFLEGLLTFVSPCHLPMLPILLYYLVGGSSEPDIKKTVHRALGFILGFTIMIAVLGALAGLLGELLHELTEERELLHHFETVVNIISGAIVVIFGLSVLGVSNLKFLHKTRPLGLKPISSLASAILFGMVFSVCWIPCMPLLVSALVLASYQASMLQGVALLLCFSLGLAAPFLLSAVLFGKLKKTFDWVKGHYKAVNIISGSFMIVMGILMMTGILHGLFDSLSLHSH